MIITWFQVAASPYALGPMYGLYNSATAAAGASSSTSPLWNQWACLGPTLLAQQQLAAAAPAAALLRPLYPRLAGRFAPLSAPPHTKSSPASSPDSAREDTHSPQSPAPTSSPFASSATSHNSP